MTALLTADEAAALHVGLNVIVRRGDEGRWAYQDEHNVWQPGAFYCDPPKAWVALTGPCSTCIGLATLWDAGGRDCPDCRDGRNLVPLYTECPKCHGSLIIETTLYTSGRGGPVGLDCDWCENGSVLVATGSIEVVPVVDRDSPETGDRIIVLPPYINTPATVWLVWRGQRHSTLDLDPLPAPGRDWGIVMDCIDAVATPPR